MKGKTFPQQFQKILRVFRLINHTRLISSPGSALSDGTLSHPLQPHPPPQPRPLPCPPSLGPWPQEETSIPAASIKHCHCIYRNAAASVSSRTAALRSSSSSSIMTQLSPLLINVQLHLPHAAAQQLASSSISPLSTKRHEEDATCTFVITSGLLTSA